MKTAVAAAIVALVSGSAAAQPRITSPPSDGSRQVRVDIADLNLASPEGVVALKVRLHFAAERVCGPAPALVELKQSSEYQRCVSAAVAGAMSHLLGGEVVAAYNSDNR